MVDTIATEPNQPMSPAILAEHTHELSMGSNETIISQEKRVRRKKGRVILRGPVLNLHLTANSLISQQIPDEPIYFQGAQKAM